MFQQMACITTPAHPCTPQRGVSPSARRWSATSARVPGDVACDRATTVSEETKTTDEITVLLGAEPNF